jgi:hypothetical protein
MCRSSTGVLPTESDPSPSTFPSMHRSPSRRTASAPYPRRKDHLQIQRASSLQTTRAVVTVRPSQLSLAIGRTRWRRMRRFATTKASVEHARQVALPCLNDASPFPSPCSMPAPRSTNRCTKKNDNDGGAQTCLAEVKQTPEPSLKLRRLKERKSCAADYSAANSHSTIVHCKSLLIGLRVPIVPG